MVEEEEVLVVFTPLGRRGYFAPGTPLLQAARSLGVDIDSVCGGRGICGRCRVTVAEGRFDKHGIDSAQSHLSPLSEPERRFAAKKELVGGCRLSCHTQVRGNVVIDVPASSQVHRQVVRKDAEAVDIELDPVVKLHYVAVEEPDMHNPIGDLGRLLEALEREWGLDQLSFDVNLLSDLQATLRSGKWKVTVAVHAQKQVIAIWPEFVDRVYGIALDVGSTTIAAHLCDLSNGEVIASAGLMNPQIRFGEDLMSRVSYLMMNPGLKSALTDAVRQAINEVIRQLVSETGISQQSILELTVVANPIMHHLLLGISPIELGGAPFALAIDSALEIKASECGVALHPGARIYFLPCIAGHVGADTAGIILAEAPQMRDEVSLLVDVGTNAEIVLGNRDRLLAASSPTGPAFEGAQISCGQRAAPGAIERVRIDPETLEPRFKVIGCDLWSDQAGFPEAVDKSGVTGICGSGIIEILAEMYLSGILDQDGKIRGELSQRTSRVQVDGRTYRYLLYEADKQLWITQSDIRAVQLAKAALYAGVQLLMDNFGVERIDRIRLAGAFGSHIDVKYAMILGLIPDCVLERVSSAGNAAGTGARIALLNAHSRGEIESLIGQVEKVETALAADFQAHFVDAMAIPHKKHAFRELRKAVRLPEIKILGSKAAARKGRSGRRPKSVA